MLSFYKTWPGRWARGFCLVGMLAFCWGCDRSGTQTSRLPAAENSNNRVIAQGQILPAGGFMQLAGAPGDIVEAVHVAVTDPVKRGMKVVTMRSETVRAKQLESLQSRREAAEREKQRSESQARRQVAAVQQKLEHLAAQHESLKRKSQLLVLAAEQVSATEQVLQKLETIANNRITSEFVGQLEIDRQRVALSEAQLSYRQQEEAHTQASEDLDWAQRAANSELEAAEEMLSAAVESNVLRVIDLEIETLLTQQTAAAITAPTDGVIVAVNVSAGETGVPLPLVEMADLSKIVCEVEINEMDAARVETGDAALVRSRAFGEKTLTGKVMKKYPMIGRPQLKPLDPLARVDYRAVTAIIELDESSSALARDWLQLQVEVEIRTQAAAGPSGGSTEKSGSGEANAG